MTERALPKFGHQTITILALISSYSTNHVNGIYVLTYIHVCNGHVHIDLELFEM